MLALNYLHKKGYLHGDVKPANILIRSKHDLEIMLADLGFATSIEEANKVNAIFGTPYYTAPEMIKGK